MNADGTFRVVIPPDVSEPPQPEAAQPDGNLGQGFLTEQARPLVKEASSEIRAGMERLRSDYWAGFLSGCVVILSFRYILKGDL